MLQDVVHDGLNLDDALACLRAHGICVVPRYIPVEKRGRRRQGGVYGPG